MENDVVGFSSILTLALIGIFAIGMLILIFSSVFTVKGKTAAILETLGKPETEARMPGLHFKMPWPITQVVGWVYLQLQEITADVVVKTKDNAFLTLPVKVQYRASEDPQGAVKAHYELEDPEEQISSYVLNNVRQTAATMNMADLYENRDAIETQVQTVLAAQFGKFGYVIENVLIDQPQPSEEVQAAFNRVIASKQLKEAAQNEADAAQIKLVGIAKAEGESKEIQGKGMAKMREAMAEGLEHAMEIMKKAGLSSTEAMFFLNETNRLDAMTTASAHKNMIIMDTRSDSTLVNSIAGVKAGAGNTRPVEVPKAS